MNDPKYNTLIKILDNIRHQAPTAQEFSRFHSRKRDDLDYTRGQAFIHLLLWVKFGIDTFEQRSQLITDGPSDGGLDAYFISQQERIVYLIQSKFKTTDTGFATESISTADLVRMELDRILQGQTLDTNGTRYNPKINEFQSSYTEATRKAIYTQRVLFLANLKQYNDSQIRKLTSNLDYEIFDCEKSYFELVKPVCSGTYYDPDRIVIELDISEKSSPQLKQTIKTSYGNCDVTAIFVPTREIARVMSKYKNAILRYNPRNYLGLSKNAVNKDIRNSVLSISYNDFALLNNGITILANEQEFTQFTGQKNVGRLTLVNPQIINGGQTAYTLSEVYGSNHSTNISVFEGKEVLVRVVVLKPEPTDPPENKYKFIQSISASTNQQTEIREADRHSADPKLVAIQRDIFLKYGYLLELKSGEFYNGLTKKFLDKKFIINRITLLRCLAALSGRPSAARSASEHELYETALFNSLISDLNASNLPKLTAQALYAYMTHSDLISLDKKLGKRSLQHGYSLRYGKYAVVHASFVAMGSSVRDNFHLKSLDEIEKYMNLSTPQILSKWKSFEDFVTKAQTNKVYFDPDQNLSDFASYYKGPNLASDIQNFFQQVKS